VVEDEHCKHANTITCGGVAQQIHALSGCTITHPVETHPVQRHAQQAVAAGRVDRRGPADRWVQRNNHHLLRDQRAGLQVPSALAALTQREVVRTRVGHDGARERGDVEALGVVEAGPGSVTQVLALRGVAVQLGGARR